MACLELNCLIICPPDLTSSYLKVEIILFIVKFPGPGIVPGSINIFANEQIIIT